MIYMFLLIIIYGYILVAALVIYFIFRDSKKPNLFFGRHKRLGLTIVALLVIGILIGLYATLIEPFVLKTNYVEIVDNEIKQPIKIAFISDMQVGGHKKDEWVKKISDRIDVEKPDLVIFGGDQIDNEGTFFNESIYLEWLKITALKYPSFYVLGNHEYGIGGSVRLRPEKYTADLSDPLIKTMELLGVKLLRNSLECLNLRQQKICLFGTDDIWKRPPNFSALQSLEESMPLIFITHNPDGILYYPDNLPQPNLVLAGHTHGGQIWIPLIGPMGDARVQLGEEYYRGLHYFKEIPIYTSVGAGESGAPLRLFAIPEIAIITLVP